MVWGKVVGGVLGFTLGGGPFGAMLGIAAGHAYDQRREFGGITWADMAPRKQAFGTQPQFSVFTSGIIILGAKMAKADGHVTREKIDAFKRVFQIKPQDEIQVGRMFDNARRSSEGFEPYAFSLAQKYCNHPSVLEEILSGLFLIAAAGKNGISPAEADFLRSVSYTFNFSADDFLRIAARTGVRLPSPEETRAARHEVKRDNGSDPYTILGVFEKSSNEEIKNAYRVLIRKHHPDKLIAEGLPPELIATANEKMKRINVAYDSLCKLRGIK